MGPPPRLCGGGRTRTGTLRAPASVTRAPGPGRCGHRVGRAATMVTGLLAAVVGVTLATVPEMTEDLSNLGFLAAEPGGTAPGDDFGEVFGAATAVVGVRAGAGLSPGVR